MMAAIYMLFENDNNKYLYGVYPYNSASECNRVNEIAQKLIAERGCSITIDQKDGNV